MPSEGRFSSRSFLDPIPILLEEPLGGRRVPILVCDEHALLLAYVLRRRAHDERRRTSRG